MRTLILATWGAVSVCCANAATCEIANTDLAFGAYDSGDAAPVDSVGTIALQCDTGLAAETVGYTILIDGGVSGSPGARAMLGIEGRLDYNLYVDGARSVVWGDGSDGSIGVGGELNLPADRNAERLVYGRIPPRQLVPPGAYADALTVRVEF